MPATPKYQPDFVTVCGERNLKNISQSVPRYALVGPYGASGSGKSSLAFGTLYTEAQRATWSLYLLRRRFYQIPVPEVEMLSARYMPSPHQRSISLQLYLIPIPVRH